MSPSADDLMTEGNVLEWRLDPHGSHRTPEVTGVDQPVVVVCSEAYASSLAADSPRAMGHQRATDLVGRFRAWRDWMVTDPTIPMTGTVS